MLTKANGKYKKNTFIFPYPAKVIIDTLISGKAIDFKKEFQFFQTPSSLAEYMVNQIIGINVPDLKFGEPSCGHGNIIDEILNIVPNANITGIELSELNYSVLLDKYESKPNVKLVNTDFLTYEPNDLFDVIIANPPFSKNQDIDHVYKMYDLLADNGQLITIMSKSWTFGNQKKQVQFREWIDLMGATTQDLESGTFKSSGTNVSGVLVYLSK
jgi:trans-aconitate methyltransferase